MTCERGAGLGCWDGSSGAAVHAAAQGPRDESDTATMGVGTLQSGAPKAGLNELNSSSILWSFHSLQA